MTTTTHNFMIGPIGDGLRKDLKPYATPQDSFETLQNAFQFRGRILRRPGFKGLARLSTDGGTNFPGNPVMGLRTRELFGIDLQQLIGFDTTTAYSFSGGAFSTLSSVMPVTWNGTNFDFFYTTNYAGAFWATNFVPGLHGWNVTLFAGSAGTGTSATVNVTSAGNTAAVGDTIYFLNLAGAAAANNLTFAVVTAINVGGNPAVITIQAVFVPATFTWANGVVTGFMLDSQQSIAGQDGIRYYANCSNNYPVISPVGNTWVNYNPPLNATTALAGALLIFPYRGYLVFLNTWEGSSAATVTNFPNRARWTQVGTPFYSNPVPNTPSLQTVDQFAARDDLFGRGGANDAPTNEIIVGAGFIRDILVVYFERSTWRLRFVNNSQNPFVWERVNIEYGSDCTFSTIPFDKGLMAIGDRGIVISDGNDTSRFDEKIPDDIFKVRQNNNGFQRVYGIRTFQTRLVYWTYPSSFNPEGIFPDQVLVFNYDTKNWSYFDDSFTCFGYFYPSEAAQTWADMTEPWSSYNITWDSGVSSQGFETVIAGNQQGYVFMLEQEGSTNDPSLSISNIVSGTVTSTNHNLQDGSWITLTGVTGTTSSDGVSLNGRNFKITNPTLDPNNFGLNEFKPIAAGNASGTSFTYNIAYTPILPGSIQINVGALVFTDPALNGILVESSSLGSGTINYNTGSLVLNFNPSIGSTAVNIRVVSYNNLQLIEPVSTTGAYIAGGQITKISNFLIETKIFNFFQDDKRSRLSKIDFYVDETANGQFTCNVLADSGNTIINQPLPDNLQSNVVLTSKNPYQFGSGDETIFRLFCDAIAQTVQLQLTMSDQQMAVNAINGSDLELLAMMITLRRGGRLP